MLDQTNIPGNRVDLIDPRTGVMSREWYRFFLSLFNNTSGDFPLAAPVDVVLTPSPFTYANGTSNTYDIIVSGGGVTKMEFIRGTGTAYDTGSYYGMFTLSPGDSLKITYVAAPTVTAIQR